jgi:hypothetical protein
MQMSELSAADVLDRAADLIDERGHYQGTHKTLRSVCAVLAISDLTPDGGASKKVALDTLCDFVGQPQSKGLTLVYRWNDDNSTAFVLAGMRACAALLRARESAPTPVAEVEHDHA